jgi:hypothetical protein
MISAARGISIRPDETGTNDIRDIREDPGQTLSTGNGESRTIA